jgi:hypothetical protein
MRSRVAELSSLHTALQDLSRRIGSIADEEMAAGQEDVAVDLQNVQRALEEATRKLARLL